MRAEWRRRRAAAATLLALATAPCAAAPTLTADDIAAQTEHLPKWEAGIALVAFSVPDYPASSDYRTLALPAPYFSYHGRVLRTDDEGSRVRRKLSPRIEIGISGGGALAADSSDSAARAGMPDLGYLVELGPNLRLSLAAPAPRARVTLNLPLRGIVSLGDPGVNWRGVMFAPSLSYWQPDFAASSLALRASFAAEFASRALQDYFYGVAPQYATAQRPAYTADAGYLGSSLGLRLTHTLSPRLRAFVALRYYNYAGAANADSPLSATEHGYTAALGMSWSFLQSPQAALPE